MRHAFGGKQLKLHGFLQRGAQDDMTKDLVRLSALVEETASVEAARGRAAGEQQQQQQAAPAEVPGGLPTSRRSVPPSRARSGKAGAPSQPAAGGKKQATLKSMFQRQQPLDASQQERQLPVHSHSQQVAPEESQQQSNAAGPSHQREQPEEEHAASQACQQAAAAAKDAWRSIQQRFQVPRCEHGEPAVLKKVNKSGPNKGERWGVCCVPSCGRPARLLNPRSLACAGRYFYTCGRPEGPRPEGKCSMFKWVEKRAGDHALTTLALNQPGGGGGGASASLAAKRPRT
jgi:AP endonuclease-2